MQLNRRVWIAMAVVCAGATLYEIPNARLIWRYALQGHSKREAPAGNKTTPILSEEVRADDPEAGDMLKYLLEDPNDQAIGDLVALYPQNEFFLAQLAQQLLDTPCVDRRAALTVADRLMSLNPENAHYRYMKGWMLLKPPRDAGDEREALRQFELANDLPLFYLPFSAYEERVDRLCEKAKITLLDRSKARPSETGMYFDLSRLLHHLHGPYPTIGPEVSAKLSTAAVVMGWRVIDNGKTFGQLEHGFFLLQLTERMRLKTALSAEQARQSRLHLAQALALNEVLQRWYDELFSSGIDLMKAGLIAVIPLGLTLQLPVVWLFLLIVNLLRGRDAREPVGVRAFILFVLGLAAFPCLLVLVVFLDTLLPGSSPGSIAFVAGPLLVLLALWLLARVSPSCSRILQTRVVQIPMLLFVATGVIRLLASVPIVPTVLSSVTLLLVGIIAIHSSQHRFIALDGLRQFFAKRGSIVVTRTKLWRLVSGVLVVSWLVILVGVHLSAGKWQRLDTMLSDPLALYGPLPQTTQETYDRMVPGQPSTGAHGGSSDTDFGVPEYLHLAAPADVEAFLAERQAENKPLDDASLLRLAVKGGRDIRPILLDTLRDPDDLEVLMKRAEWGDSTAKKQLVTRFEEQFAQLGEPYTQIRQDPNGFQSLALRTRWSDELARTELERRFAARVTRLIDTPEPGRSRNDLRSELHELVIINAALTGSSQRGGPKRVTRRDRQRSALLEQLLADADMLDLEPPASPAEVSTERLELLLDLAEALAFVSEPPEAKARFQWLMAPLVEKCRQDRARSPHSHPLAFPSNKFALCLFFRALKGLPQSEATDLLTQYVKAMQPSEVSDENEFLDILARADGRALAEWVLQEVAEAPPSEDVTDVPVERIVNISEKLPTHREDTSHKYLEPAFAHLTTASVPLLLEHLDSDHAPLRAFVVWRLTSLGYDWPHEQVRNLLADNDWKVRLNALFACTADDLEAAASDQNSIVRALVRLRE